MNKAESERRVVAGLLALGALLRLLVVFGAWGGPYDPYVRIEGDSADYLSLGLSLSRGEGYSFHYRPWLRETLAGLPVSMGPSVPTAMRSPGYPAFLAAVFAIAGPRLHLVLLLQALLSALVPFFVYRIAREVRAPAIASLAFAVFYVPFWFDAAYVMSEGLHTFFTALALWLLVRPGREGLAGVAAGAGILVKSVMTPFFLAAGLFLGGRRTAVYLIALACVVGPWASRNAAHGAFISIAPTLGGYQAFALHNPLNRELPLYSRPGDQNEDYAGFQVRVREIRASAPRVKDPVDQEWLEVQALLIEAARYARANPFQALRASGASVVNLWRFDTPIAHWRAGYSLPNLARWVSTLLLCGVLMPFAIVGVLLALRYGPSSARFIALYLLAFALIHAPLSAGLRYRTAAMPAFFVMAALGLAAVGAWRRAGSATHDA